MSGLETMTFTETQMCEIVTSWLDRFGEKPLYDGGRVTSIQPVCPESEEDTYVCTISPKNNEPIEDMR